METEKVVEQHLRKQTEANGGMCYKFVSPGRVNVPDRIVILPGIIAFVECKGTDGKVSKKQDRELKRLANLQMNVFVVYSKKNVDEVIERMMRYVRLQKSTPVSKAGNN
jgi:hypothetical protein